ncbi:TPM domain-containing protein [Cognataquiflexum rubidum]|uniref:TPM domain-containing protein n=1 Tax=Cognataquiflexum rubidum TaxID=2922273 RepID=UPI001F12EA9C|nr:TPM domain-containing protein [Cognataquiflexum rubidum]MCH6233868.1 TPM domain-containing protein [Cognataquiflexum rubidum]
MAENLFSQEDKNRIVSAIAAAEMATSGEIQVHIENHCRLDVLDRAAEVFETLKMHKTKERNAVLFYLAVADHKFAILGDSGINKVVPENFWEKIKEEMAKSFKQQAFTEGLSTAIEACGQQLKAHFPYDNKGDLNELSDEISFG